MRIMDIDDKNQLENNDMDIDTGRCNWNNVY